MAARRPKAQTPATPKKVFSGEVTPPKKENLAALFPPPERSAEIGIPYASLRTKSSPGNMRQSGTNHIQASRDQGIYFLKEPYPHFRVTPGGHEIPVENVASAIPVQSQIAEKLSRKERLAKRARNIEEKMGERTAEKQEREEEREAKPLRRAEPRAKSTPKKERPAIQEIPSDDDDIDDSLDEDELDGATEGEASDD